MNLISRSMWFVVVWLLAAPQLNVAASAPKTDTIWRLVAKSHLIVIGTPQIPIESIQESISSKKYEYVNITVACDQTLKGTARKTVVVRWYTRPEPGSLGLKELTALRGKPAVLFLIEVDEKGSEGFYLAGNTPSAFSEANTVLTERVRVEVNAQRNLLERFDKVYPPQDEPLCSKVKALVDATTKKDTQLAAFHELEALGTKGVPAMILLMDDRRELPKKAISLRNPPDHWEAIRHYGPETVTDAIAAILSQITGESFGFVYNGASERERREAVNGWRVYLSHREDRETQPR